MYTIIGGGIAGLTTALAFEKAGIDYHLFERAAAFEAVGAGIWLAPNALTALKSYGLLDELRDSGNELEQILLTDAQLKPISRTPLHRIRDTFGYSTIAIHRADLQKILYRQIPRNKITFGKSMDKMDVQNTGIRLQFSDGSTHQAERLIAADGIHSRVREQLFSHARKRYSGQTCWRGISAIQLEESLQRKGLESWGGEYRLGFSRLNDAQVYWFAVGLRAPNGQDQPEQVKADLQQHFATFDPLINQIIEQTPSEQIFRNDIYDLVPLSRWYQGNICLIGDAAHATTPNMGQGGAQAIEDAYYLAKIIQSEAPENAFETFQQSRYKKATSVVQRSWNMGKLAHWRRGKWLRNTLMKSVPERWVVKGLMDLYSL